MRKSTIAVLVSGSLLSFSAIAQVGVDVELEVGSEVEVVETDVEAGAEVDMGVDADLDLSLDVIESPEEMGEMIGRIQLPESASEQGRISSAAGLERANAAREGGEAFGQSIAEQARENRGRPDGVGRPDDIGGRPDDAGRPDDVGGIPDGVGGRPDGVGRPQ